jgi:hypothetical protein
MSSNFTTETRRHGETHMQDLRVSVSPWLFEIEGSYDAISAAAPTASAMFSSSSSDVPTAPRL